jgi:hypothetical protein
VKKKYFALEKNDSRLSSKIIEVNGKGQCYRIRLHFSKPKAIHFKNETIEMGKLVLKFRNKGKCNLTYLVQEYSIMPKNGNRTGSFRE